MQRSMAALTFLVLCGAAGRAAAGDASTPDILRKRVRLSLEGDRRVQGRLTAMDAETFTLFPDGKRAPVRIERAQVQRLEVSRGRTRYTLVGVAIGLGVGVALPVHEPCDSSPALFCPRGINRMAAVGGSLIAGAVLGSAVSIERWHDVGDRRVRVGLALPPRGQGLGAAVSVRF